MFLKIPISDNSQSISVQLEDEGHYVGPIIIISIYHIT